MYMYTNTYISIYLEICVYISVWDNSGTACACVWSINKHLDWQLKPQAALILKFPYSFPPEGFHLELELEFGLGRVGLEMVGLGLLRLGMELVLELDLDLGFGSVKAGKGWSLSWSWSWN